MIGCIDPIKLHIYLAFPYTVIVQMPDGSGGFIPTPTYYYTVARFDLLDPPSLPTINAKIRNTYLGLADPF